MTTIRSYFIILASLTMSLGAQTILDFATSNEGFIHTGVAGGSFSRVTDTGSGSLRLTNPSAWTWRTKADFNKNGTGKAKEIALALGLAGQSGGFLHFDLIFRPATAVTGKTAGFTGVQYNVAIQQQIPGGASGWVQKVAHALLAGAFPPTAEITIPVTVPLRNWAESTTELRIHPDSSYYQIQFGTSSGAVTQVEWHIDNLRVEVPPTAPGVIQLEAEAGTLTGVTVASVASGFNGTGYVTGFDQLGDHVTWSFPAAAGVHRLSIRYRSPGDIKGFAGSVNGGGFSGFFPGNNNFATYDTGLVELIAGSNTLTIGGEWNFYEIDSVTLVPDSPLAPPSPGPGIPADPAATPAARALLTALLANYGQKAYSGQQEAEDLPLIQTLTGKLPAILAGDLVDYSPSRVAHQGAPVGYTESLIARAAQGHIVSVLWHWNAPVGLINTPAQPWWRGFYTEATTFDIAAALANTGSPEYALVLRDIDAIAIQLKKFDQANIPILWRPLHEAEGAWFWWGAKGPDAFKQLWNLLYTRLTVHHGLHNLIWVLTVEDPAWYPGNDVVDVVGVDAYPTDRTDALFPRWQPLRNRFNGVKPIALTEFGGVPDIEKMNRLGIWWSWFCSWEGPQNGPSSAPPATTQRIYQSNSVITLDELAPVPSTIDTNNDGVLDSETSALGISPTLDLRPMIAFFKVNSERFDLGFSATAMDAARLAARREILDFPNAFNLFTSSQLESLAMDRPFLVKNPIDGIFSLNMRLLQSSDLTHWNVVTPTDSTLQSNGTLTLKLPAVGNAAFYQVLGEAP